MAKQTALPPKANSPSLIRASFLTYLRSQFPYENDWVHPTSNITYEHGLIKRRLAEYKQIDPTGYRALWYLWSTQGTRNFIAEQLNCSGTTLKRLWDKVIDTFVMMLWYPDLIPEAFALDKK